MSLLTDCVRLGTTRAESARWLLPTNIVRDEWERGGPPARQDVPQPQETDSGCHSQMGLPLHSSRSIAGHQRFDLLARDIVEVTMDGVLQATGGNCKLNGPVRIITV